MKKIKIIMIAAVILVALAALGNFIMVRATADKAAATIASMMERLELDYDYERAYINPITKSLYVEGLLLEDEIKLAYLKLSKFNETIIDRTDAAGIDGEITATIELRGLDIGESNEYMRIGKLKLKELHLANYDGQWWPQSVNDLLMKDFKSLDGIMEISMASLEYNGELRIPLDYSMGFRAFFENMNAQSEIKGLSIKVAELEPIEISSIKSISKADDGGNYLQTTKVNGKLFTLDASVSGITKGSDIDGVLVSDFSISYDDKALFDYIIAAVEKEAGKTGVREDILKGLEYQDFDQIVDGETFKKLVTDFITEPQSLTLTGKALGEPVSVYDIINSDLADQIEIMLAVNDNAPFQIKRNPEYGAGESGMGSTLGGMVVDFIVADAGRCNFISHREDGDYPFSFGCSLEDVAYFESVIEAGAAQDERGFFYIEYNTEHKITFTDLAEGYEDWGGEDESGEYYELANSDKAGGQHLDFITADYDPGYDEYLCSFTSLTDDSERILYCDAEDVEYFENTAGPFYVEFDYGDTVIAYSTDWEDYKEWYAEDY